MAVDILPTALPIDASTHFSNVLVPYLGSLIAGYQRSDQGKLKGALDRATVAQEGQLLEKHAWLGEKVKAWRTSSSGETQAMTSRKRVLILGSGMVAGPAISEICKRGDIELIVGKLSFERPQTIAFMDASQPAILCPRQKV